MFFQQHCKKCSLHRASQNDSFPRAVEIFPSSMRNLGPPNSAKLLGNARKIPYCISGFHRAVDLIRRLFAYTAFMWNLPKPVSATSPFGARSAGRRFRLPSKPRPTVGLLLTVLCVERNAGTCRLIYSGGLSRTFCLSTMLRGGLRVGEMRRAISREEQDRRTQDRFASTIVIAASIIAAVRLAREPNISRPSPRLTSVVADSVGLARMILDRVVR